MRIPLPHTGKFLLGFWPLAIACGTSGCLAFAAGSWWPPARGAASGQTSEVRPASPASGGGATGDTGGHASGDASGSSSGSSAGQPGERAAGNPPGGTATGPGASPSPEGEREGLGLFGISDRAGRSTLNGLPDDLVTLHGSGFKLAPPASYSVRFGAAEVPPHLTLVRDAGRMVVAVPRGFKRGKVAVTLGAVTAASSGSFTAIASLSLSPLSATLGPGERRKFEVAAYDADGLPIAAPNVPWGMLNQVCFGNGCEDHDAAKVEDGVAVGELDVGDFVLQPGGTRVRVSKPGTLVAYGDIFVGNLFLMATGHIEVRIPE